MGKMLCLWQEPAVAELPLSRTADPLGLLGTAKTSHREPEQYRERAEMTYACMLYGLTQLYISTM